MPDQDLQQFHLDRVSRSFAFCIARLPLPLRNYVGLSYLLCRVIDTAEDAVWIEKKAKSQSFIDFQEFLQSKPTSLQVTDWAVAVTQNGISENEKNLLSDFSTLLNNFYSIPENIRTKMQKSILCMSKGMHFFSEKYPEGLRLKNLTEVNQYCFFVAGIVGELLTDLMSEFVDAETFPKDIYLKAHHFGLFLQKINILKDQKEDELNKKFFIHDKDEFIASLKFNAQNALQYILHIPVNQKEFRLFCSWSLFIGLSSLNWIQNSWLTAVANKIPRWMTEQILLQTENVINDNLSLQKFFTDLLPDGNLVLNSGIDAEAIALFQKLYQGPLSSAELSEIAIS